MKENIEEDLKKTENLIECFRKAEIVNLECKESMYQRCNYSHYKAIEHILSDYKRVLKENEELKDRWDKDTHKLQNDLDIANAEKIKIQKENEKLKDYRRRFVDVTDNELKETNYYFMYKYTFRGDELAQHINTLLKAVNNSILKQKIKDKIEELKNKSGGNVFHIQQTINAEIRLLKDLLESEG